MDAIKKTRLPALQRKARRSQGLQSLNQNLAHPQQQQLPENWSGARMSGWAKARSKPDKSSSACGVVKAFVAWPTSPHTCQRLNITPKLFPKSNFPPGELNTNSSKGQAAIHLRTPPPPRLLDPRSVIIHMQILRCSNSSFHILPSVFVG